MNKYYIPIYGMALGVMEHSRALAAHRHAIAEYRKSRTPQNEAATWTAYRETWRAFEREEIGFISTLLTLGAGSLICVLVLAAFS